MPHCWFSSQCAANHVHMVQMEQNTRMSGMYDIDVSRHDFLQYSMSLVSEVFIIKFKRNSSRSVIADSDGTMR